MSTLAERIDFIIKSNAISAAELARKAGISKLKRLRLGAFL